MTTTYARIPLTPAMIKAQGKSARAALAPRSELPTLLIRVAEALTEVLAGYTASPFRAEADGIAPDQREVPVPGAEGVKLTSARGPLSPLLLADRSFIMGLCESGFGGSGTEQPYDGEERPLSRTEARLIKAVLQDTVSKLPELLCECFNTRFEKVSEDGRRPPPQPVTTTFTAGRVLVYFFGYSGELRLLLPESELAALLAHEAVDASAGGQPESDRASYRRAVLESQIEVTAQLPQETLTLGDVAALRKGQLLKFKASVHTPLELVGDGVLLGRARLSSGSQHIVLEIIDT